MKEASGPHSSAEGSKSTNTAAPKEPAPGSAMDDGSTAARSTKGKGVGSAHSMYSTHGTHHAYAEKGTNHAGRPGRSKI